MTRQRHADRVLEEWLAGGPDNLSDAAIDRIVRRVDQTAQRKSGWLPGSTYMNRFLLSGAAVAAVVVVAGALYVGQGNGVTPAADPSMTPAPSISPIPLPASGGGLAPGVYRVWAETAVPVQLSVPSGWSAVEGGWAILKESAGELLAGLSFWSPNQATLVYADPCDWEGNFAEPDSLVDRNPTAVTDALAAQHLRGDAEPTDIKVDGYAGKLVELTLPADLDFSTCDGGEPYSWLGRAHQGPGQVDHVYAVDVDGELLVFDATYMPDAPRELIAELEAIVDSILIAPPASP
jgi:hypothetical protein